MYGASAWSQVPPFMPASAPPVLVMRNNAAVIGATLGSVSLFLSLIPLIGIVAWVLAPIGLLSSGVGLLVGVSRKVGRVGALWGLLTSGVALARVHGVGGASPGALRLISRERGLGGADRVTPHAIVG